MKLLLIAFMALGVFIPAQAEERMCTMQYEPVCGAQQVQCITTPCYPMYHTYGNACMLAAEGATFIHEGACTAKETGPVIPREPYTPPAHCSAWFDGCNQCGRGEDGQSFCTLMACVGEPAPGYCIRYDDPPQATPAPASPPSSPTTATSSAEEAPAETQGFFARLWQSVLDFFSFF
jgi:hypothetical protein